MDDKKNRKALEELSAYLDGEAVNPAEVKRRIEEDPDAARMAKDFSSLSTELGRLPAPDVHPGFRTRVMANVRETPRESAPPLVSWPWRAFAAMVVLTPFAAVMWTFLWLPQGIPEVDSQRALVHYLLEQDEEVVLNELAALFVDEMDRVWSATGDAGDLESVPETEWLDVLAMDADFVAWDGALGQENWGDLADSLSDDEVREFRILLMEQASGDVTI